MVSSGQDVSLAVPFCRPVARVCVFGFEHTPASAHGSDTGRDIPEIRGDVFRRTNRDPRRHGACRYGGPL